MYLIFIIYLCSASIFLAINGADPALHIVKSKKYWEDCKHQILKFCNEKDFEIRTGNFSKILSWI